MNRRYSWTSHSEDESDYQREPDWQEVRFPLKFPQDAVEEYERLEWSIEVTTPDQEIIAGVARMRRDQVNIRFQPFQNGVHKVQVLTDGRPFCPPLYFDVLDDGSSRRLASPPGDGGGEGVQHQHQQQRSRMLKKRRDRGPSKSSELQLSEDEDYGSAAVSQTSPRRPGAAEKRQQQQSRRRSRGESADRQRRHSGQYSGYQPSESDQYESHRPQQRNSRSSLGQSGQLQQRPRRDSSFRDSSSDRSRPQSAVSGTTSRAAVSPRRPSRSASQTSYDRTGGGGGGGGDVTVRARGGGGGGGGRSSSYSRASSSQRLQRRDSSLSRYSSDQDRSRPPSASQQQRRVSAASSSASLRRHQRSVSDSESLMSRRDSFDASHPQRSAPGRRSSRHSRGSRYSSADEQGFVEAGRSRTASELRDDGPPYHRTQGLPPPQQQQSMRHQSASNIRHQQQQQQPFRQRQVSAFALGAVPARAPGAMPFGANKGGPFDGQAPTMSQLRQQSVEEAADFEVISSSAGGESFILKGRQMLAIRTLGKSAGGEELVQSEDGSIFLIKHGRAVPMQQGYSAPGRSQSPPAGMNQQTQRLASPVGPMTGAALPAPIPVKADGKPRCCVCSKKATSAKQRAFLQGLLYCHKHFKELFFHKPADAHKKFLFVDLADVPSPGMPLHPRANFTALSFKQFLKAQEEFKKYDPGNRGMIPKDMTFPILQQLLVKNGLKERKLQQYFNGPHYPKLLMDVQAVDEAEVSELQFLNLLALIMREMTRKWLQTVKVHKSKQMTKAWSTTALDGGRAPAAITEAGRAADFSSQSYTAMGMAFSAAPPRQSRAGLSAAGPKQLKHGKRAMSTSIMPYSQQQQPAKNLHQQRRHTEAALNYQQPSRRRQTSSSRDDDDSEEDDAEDAAEDRHPVFDRQAYPKHRSNGRGARSRSELADRHSYRRRREDPEGRSHEDISLSGTRGSGGGGNAVKSGHGHGSEVAATKPHATTSPMSSSSAGDSRPRRTSQAAHTREEALAARAQLQQILRREGAVSTTGSESALGDEDGGENEGQREDVTPAPAPGGGGSSGQTARLPDQEQDTSSEAEESEEESEGSGVDSEQLLEESDEEEGITQSEQEVGEVPISGNRVADAWMLY